MVEDLKGGNKAAFVQAAEPVITRASWLQSSLSGQFLAMVNVFDRDVEMPEFIVWQKTAKDAEFHRFNICRPIFSRKLLQPPLQTPFKSLQQFRFH